LQPCPIGRKTAKPLKNAHRAPPEPEPTVPMIARPLFPLARHSDPAPAARAAPRRFAPRSLARRLTVWASALALAASASLPARAQSGGPVIRDTEIESLLRDYARPILKAAGLSRQNVDVVIINSADFNAFVADARRIFINHGTLLESKTPNEIIGILAHETGHIAGGHLSRMRDRLAKAQTQSIIAMILSMGAVIAAGRSGNVGGNPSAAILAPQQMIRSSLLAYQRSQEEQADRAGVKFLTATGQSAKGMSDTFRRLADQSLFQTRGTDPYARSHPMPAERVAALAELARSSPYWAKTDAPALQLRHDMMRAKISGFMERPETVFRRYPMRDQSLPARYARAIATYRHGDLRNAVAQIDALINTQPNNPYLYELRGQALLEGARPAEAIAPLRKAVTMTRGAPLIEMLLGQALVGTNNPAHADEAIRLLRNALSREPEAALGFTQLAMAYGRKGQYADADLAAAQAAYLRGDFKTARDLASRAKSRFAIGSPGWVRADDIVSAKPPQKPK